MDGLPFSICHRNPVMGSKGTIAKPLSSCKICIQCITQNIALRNSKNLENNKTLCTI